MRQRDRSLFANSASLVVCGLLAGVVVAAAAFPAVAMGGLAAKAGADTFGELPTELDVLPSPQISYVYASDNKTLLATLYDENRHDITLAEVPMVMRNAIIAAEDSRFYKHHGVDLQGIIRAFVANQQTDDDQGASTLTMQYVRQAITYSASSPETVIAATEKTNARKLREARLALSLETVLTKDQILERYLNIAAFGNGAYGVYAASQVYFGKEPKDLKLEEAATLAGLVKAPSDYDPTTEKGAPEALKRRGYVLDQMVDNNMVTRAQADAARTAKLKLVGNRTPNGCVNTRKNQWGFFCDYLRRWWIDQEAFGETVSERETRLKAGGYRIVTSLDVKVQDAAKKNVESQVKTGQSDALMLAAIEPGTGRVRAMAVNRTFGLDTSKNPLSTDPSKRRLGIKATYPVTSNPLLSGGGDITGYKAGSTFKIFTAVAALEKGFPLDFTIRAVSPYQSKYVVGANDISVCADKVHWCPQNAVATMSGVHNMWTGFGGSVNTYFVPLEEKAGAHNAINVSKRLGIKYRAKLEQDFTSPGRAETFGPFTIGVTDTVPLELANAYATLAADGKYCEPLPVVQIIDHQGQKLDNVTAPRCKQVVKPEVARAAVDIARCPIRDRSLFNACKGATTGGYDDGTGRLRSIRDLIGHPTFGKTGTSDENWTANLVISTKQLAIAATLANPDYAQTPHNQLAARKANTAAAWTMRDAMKGKPQQQFTKAPDSYAYGTRVRVPNVTCNSVDEARSRLRSAGFDVTVESKPEASPCAKGTVARTDPSGSTSKGGTVAIYVSDGPGTGPTTPPSGGGGGGPGGGGGGGGGGNGGIIADLCRQLALCPPSG